MADIFDQISEEEITEKGDIFDLISPDVEPAEPRGRVAEAGAALARGGLRLGEAAAGLAEKLYKIIPGPFPGLTTGEEITEEIGKIRDERIKHFFMFVFTFLGPL